jgi:hypothetical protein
MSFPTFKAFFETTASDPSINAAVNGYGDGNAAGKMRTSRITGTSKNPNLLAQSSINTQTATKNNKIDKVANNPTAQEVLNDLDLQEIQNTHGIDLNQMQNDEPKQVNSKINAAVVKSVDAAGKPMYRLIHYKPIQQ